VLSNLAKNERFEKYSSQIEAFLVSFDFLVTFVCQLFTKLNTPIAKIFYGADTCYFQPELETNRIC